jgi:murein DD-endopeptidase MepM/ murein hydrolase activator NlpD
VAPGDTLAGISRLHGVSIDAIVAANDLADPGAIVVGQRLVIPGPAGVASTPTAAPTTVPTAVPTATSVPPTPTRMPPTPTMRSDAGTVFRSIPATGGTGGGTAQAASSAGRGGRGAGLFLWPLTGGISTRFGEDGHTGIDIMADMGDPVISAGSGVVTVALESDYGYGWRVEVDHGNGLTTLYAHLSAFAVKTGDRVVQGQRLGSAGSTGYSTGPHVHFEVRAAGVPVDPMPYLP